jgi:hypothetical protein
MAYAPFDENHYIHQTSTASAAGFVEIALFEIRKMRDSGTVR